MVPGRRYRIEHIGGIIPADLATFIRNINPGIGHPVHSEFNNIITSRGVIEPPMMLCSYSTNEWIFFESADEIISGQVARGITKRVGENAADLIQRMLIGNKPAGRGPNRFPSRSRKSRKSRR